MKRTVLAVVAMLATGCSATGYHPASFAGGYTDTKLADDTFRVSFSANGWTSSTQAADFALLRASELCLNGEYPFYAVVTQNDDLHVSYHVTGGSNPSVTTVEKPSTRLLVKCLMDKEHVGGIVVDAKMLRREIRAKYEITD